MLWHNDGKTFEVYNFGDRRGRKACWQTASNSKHNHIYTLGADQSLAGNSNRNLDVSYDELVIWYGKPSAQELKASRYVVEGMVLVVVVNMACSKQASDAFTAYAK